VGAPPAPFLTLFVQIAAALYLSFAVLNWMASGSTIGGVYNRPVAMANFFHFFVAAIALVKAVMAGQRAVWLLVAAVLYVLFTAAFGWLVFFWSPVKPK
jgi:hypothetical protein